MDYQRRKLERVLVRTPNHLGDCVMSLPTINYIREVHAGAEIVVLAPAALADLFRSNPSLDEVIEIPPGSEHGLGGVVRTRQLIAEREFDTAYVLAPSFGAAAAIKLAGIKNRIGYVTDGRRLLLTKPLAISTPPGAVHRAEQYLNVLRRGAGAKLDFVRPKLFVSDEETLEGMNLLRGFGFKSPEPYAVISFWAVAQSRRWGTEKYAQLAAELSLRQELAVVLIGTKEDRHQGEQLKSSIPMAKVINIAGKTSLRELAAVMSRAEIFVGNDSGPAHLAAAVGIPLVVLSGADDPGETSPLSPNLKRIRMDHLECIGCVKNTCPLTGSDQMRCMTDISVARVMNSIEEVLNLSVT